MTSSQGSETSEVAEHIFRRAVGFQQQRRLNEAAHAFGQVLEIAPAHPDALHFLGIIEAQRGQMERAVLLIGQSVTLNPENVAALCNYAKLLRETGRMEEAIEVFNRAIALKPDHFGAIAARGTAFQALGRNSEALESYTRSLAIDPNQPNTLYNRGLLLCALGDWPLALESFGRALMLKPEYTAALHCRGKVLLELKGKQDALADFDRALIADPNNAELHHDRASALLALGRDADALLSLDRVLANAPDHSDGLNLRGYILARLGRLDEALESYNRAVNILPGNVGALINRGVLLSGRRQFDDACRDFENALSLDPRRQYLGGMVLECKLHCCDWEALFREKAAIREAVRRGERAVWPMVNVNIAETAQDQLTCAQIWIRNEFPASPAPVWNGERYAHDRIRIAYLAPEMGFNPVATQIAGVLEAHDASRYEIALVPFGQDHGSPMRVRIEKACEHVLDVRPLADAEAAKMLRQMEMDILVDLAGLTGSCRTGVLALRPAPVQVNFLGYPASMGADYIDYILADRIVIPEKDRESYSEKVVYLPDTLMPNDSGRPISEIRQTRSSAGLPDEAFVFCCFNNAFKFTPEIFDVWMRLLNAVNGSVLWLPQFNAVPTRNLRREAEWRGVNADRLIFAPFAESQAEHLARLGLADLCLDTLPYNAHATACDALWAGLPVLTCSGPTFAGRVGASLLQAIGLPELIAGSLTEYEAMALHLATHRDRLAEIRDKLARHRLSYPLFNTPRYVRHLEAAFLKMWEISQSGGAPDHFTISPMH